MDSARLTSEILLALGFPPTADQRCAAEEFARFMFFPNHSSAMLLTGSAGTGKTSLAAAIVRTMKRLGQSVRLMAPTGRAAKVFALSAGQPAFTIHRQIYRQNAFQGIDTAFALNFNKSRDTLFIVDEASMIADEAFDNAFGSGSLLQDLIRFVYSGENCHLMLIGDSAQLPPVGCEESPALMPHVLEGYGLTPFSSRLDEVLRQSQGSGILSNATMIRQLITHDEATHLPKIRFKAFADIVRVDGGELIERLSSSYSEVGQEETMVICRSNKTCNIYNNGIRARILDREHILESGDQVMIVRNYYRLPADEDEKKKQKLSFLANGDIAVVRRIRHERTLYGFRFADVTLRFPDYDDLELQLPTLLDTLTTDAPALPREQHERLFQAVWNDYPHLTRKADRLRAVREDDHLNALQIKYAYAVTCHKAQGGQWAHIYLDQGYMTDEFLTPDYIHWLYTAFTRATAKLFLVNWPPTQIAEE